MSFYLLLCFLCLFSLCEGVSREETGYPYAFFPDCPGSTKPAIIPRSDLKHIKFILQRIGMPRKTYNYFNAKDIAKDPRIDFKRKTVMLVSGYLDRVNFGIAVSKGYEARNYNIIMLEIQKFSVHYFLTSRLTRPVGKHVAEVLVQLTELGLDPSKLEIVGLSQGSHTIGFVGKNYQQMTGRNISRITGLDPAGPCFRNLGPELRLAPSDADFVDVLHTNIDGYGMPNRMGHVDVYINGGEYQPSDINFFSCSNLCSHLISISYWMLIVNHPKKFKALKCDSIQQARDNKCYDRVPLESNLVGVDMDRTKHGIYYLATSKDYPFFLGDKGLKKEFMVWNTIANNYNNETELLIDLY